MSKKLGFQNCRVVATGVNSDEYHKDNGARGTMEFKMSPSQLHEFDHCPKRWIDGYDPNNGKVSKAKKWGNLLDCVVLTPDQFDTRYVVRPAKYYHKKSGEERDWSGNATDCQNWIADNVKSGMTLLSPEMYEDVQAAVAKIHKDDIIKVFIASSDTQVHVEGEWHDEKTELIIPVRCLIDLVPRNDTVFYKGLGDLKSCRSAALGAFSKDAKKNGYHVQGAFDIDLYRMARPDEDRCNWCLVVQESYSPWATARRFSENLPDQPANFIRFGRKVYQRILANYCVCLKTGVWPSYDDHEDAAQGWTTLYVDEWDNERESNERRLKMPEEEDEESTEEEIDEEERFDIH